MMFLQKRFRKDLCAQLIEGHIYDEKAAVTLVSIGYGSDKEEKVAEQMFVEGVLGRTDDGRYYYIRPC